MATPTMMMGAAAPARRKAGTTALRQPAIDPHAAQSAETGTGLVRREAIRKMIVVRTARRANSDRRDRVNCVHLDPIAPLST